MLHELIRQRRDAIVSAWFDHIVDGYPSETARFLRTRTDRFDNPMGHALREGLGSLVDATIEARDMEATWAALDRIIRIRAVQEIQPSAAVAFVLDLKRVVRGVVPDDAGDTADLRAVEDRIDQLALLAFDVYAVCREDVSRIRVEAIRNRSMKVMERFNAWQDRRAERQADRTVRPEEGGRS
jgi:hypothetical protein